MINTMKLIKLAKKWQRAAAIGRKRISPPRTNGDVGTCSSSSMPDRGHFVVYTADGKRFVFPIAYLNNYIFSELLKLAEDEYGLPPAGPLTVPCDAVFMEYAVSLIKRHAAKTLEKALIMSLSSDCYLACSYSQLGQHNPQSLISSF